MEFADCGTFLPARNLITQQAGRRGEDQMPAHRVLINAQDYTHIRITQPHQLRYWTGRFSVTEFELLELINMHGSAVATIVRILSARVQTAPQQPAGNA